MTWVGGVLLLTGLLNLYSAWCYRRAKRRYEQAQWTLQQNAVALERDYHHLRAEVSARLEALMRDFMANPHDPKWWVETPPHVH